MTAYLLKALLSEYLRQLVEAADEAQRHLELQGEYEPERCRVWNAGLIYFSQPTAESPADQWHWEDRYPRFVALAAVDEAIQRFQGFVDDLPVGAEEQNRS